MSHSDSCEGGSGYEHNSGRIGVGNAKNCTRDSQGRETEDVVDLEIVNVEVDW